MIMKLLLVIGVIGIIYFMFIKKKPSRVDKKDKVKKDKKDEIKSNDMVECVTCGVFVDIDESILSSNKYYCSDECLKGIK